MNTKTLTRTALLIALLVAVQYVTKAAGQIVTGSAVNLILATAALTCSLWSGIAIALISPFCAFLLGIGTPILQLVPAIALGNAVYVAALVLFTSKTNFKGNTVAAVLLAAVLKFLTLYGVIVCLLLPLMGLPEAKVAVLSATFSYPQLITALIGGALALIITPALKKLR